MIKRKACMGALLLCALTLQPLHAEPDSGITGTLRISSLEDLANSIAAFAKNATPEQGEEIAAQVAQLPAFAQQLGIDPKGELGAVLLNPSSPDTAYAVILPILDVNATIKNPDLNLTKSTEDPSVYTFTPPNAPTPFFAAFEGNRAIVAPALASIAPLRAAVKADSVLAPLRGAGGQLSLDLAFDKLWTIFRPMAEGMTAGIPAEEGNAAAVQAQMKSFLDFLSEVQSLGFRINLQPDAIVSTTTVSALPNTNLAKFLNIAPGPVVDYLGMLPSDAAVNGTFSMKPTPEMAEAYMGWLSGYLKLIATTEAGKDVDFSAWETSMRKIMVDSLSMWDGGAAFTAMSPSGDGTFVTGIYGITDAAKAKAVLQEIPKMQESMNSLQKATGTATSLKLESTSTYGGAELLNYTMSYEFTDEDTKEEAEKALEMMGLGENVPTVYAITPTKLVYSMGEGATESTKALVDKLSKPAPPAPVTPAQFGLPANPHLFVTISAAKIMSFISEDAAEDKGPSAPGIAMAATLNGSGNFIFTITAKEIQRLTELSAQMKKAGEGEGEEENDNTMEKKDDTADAN